MNIIWILTLLNIATKSPSCVVSLRTVRADIEFYCVTSSVSCPPPTKTSKVCRWKWDVRVGVGTLPAGIGWRNQGLAGDGVVPWRELGVSLMISALASRNVIRSWFGT